MRGKEKAREASGQHFIAQQSTRITQAQNTTECLCDVHTRKRQCFRGTTTAHMGAKPARGSPCSKQTIRCVYRGLVFGLPGKHLWLVREKGGKVGEENGGEGEACEARAQADRSRRARHGVQPLLEAARGWSA